MNFIYAVLLLPCIFLCAEISSKEMEGFEGFESQYDYSASHVRKVRQLKYERDIYNNGKTKVSGNIGINSVTPPQGQIGIKVHHDVNKRVYVFGQGEVSGGFNGSKFRYTGSSGQVGIGIRF